MVGMVTEEGNPKDLQFDQIELFIFETLPDAACAGVGGPGGPGMVEG